MTLLLCVTAMERDLTVRLLRVLIVSTIFAAICNNVEKKVDPLQLLQTPCGVSVAAINVEKAPNQVRLM